MIHFKYGNFDWFFLLIIYCPATSGNFIVPPQAGQTSAVEGLEKCHGEKSETEEVLCSIQFRITGD